MKTIYKYEIEMKDHSQINIKGFRGFLKVGEQDESLFLWCLVETSDDINHTIDVYIQGTGTRINNSSFSKSNYFDSVIMSNGLVWHIALN
jgi:hypothetical protein